MQVTVSTSARQDIRSVVIYYSEQSPELPAAFLRELDDAFELIAGSPEIGSPIGNGHQKVVLQRFPYIVIYRKEHDQLLVLAVGHQRRRPGFWK